MAGRARTNSSAHARDDAGIGPLGRRLRAIRAEIVASGVPLLDPEEIRREVLDRGGQAGYGIDHERAGELVALAAPNAWLRGTAIGLHFSHLSAAGS